MDATVMEITWDKRGYGHAKVIVNITREERKILERTSRKLNEIKKVAIEQTIRDFMDG